MGRGRGAVCTERVREVGVEERVGHLPQKNLFLSPNSKSGCTFDAVFSTQKTRTVARSSGTRILWNEVYEYSANMQKKFRGQTKGKGGAVTSSPPPSQNTPLD